MSTTVSLDNGKRADFELPYENYQAHKDVVDAWFYEGKEIERHEQGSTSLVWNHILTPSWVIGGVYRIAERKPLKGEVWENTLGPGYGLLCNKVEGDHVEFTGLSNGTVDRVILGKDDLFKYAAPSVEAYYLDKLRPVIAREFLDEAERRGHEAGSNEKAFEVFDIVGDAAETTQ